MASEPKKAKADPAPKKADPPPKAEVPAPDKSTPTEGVAKVEGGATAAAAEPSTYSRGEGQKPVTRAYKENWNAIFAKKSITKSAKKSVKKNADRSAKKRKR
jgi:hypothetical protein